MSGPENTETPPDGVPEEFADAYREAFRHALAEAAEPALAEAAEPAPARGRRTGVLFAVAVVVMFLVGFGVVRALDTGSGVEPGRARTPDGASALPTSPGPTRSSGESRAATLPTTTVRVGCVAPPAVDSAGKPVDYRPANVLDGDPATAWRCPGPATGVTLVFDFAAPVRITSLGLIPGYAKTDPTSGVDRYAEDNRITRVRWIFDDGTSLVQGFDPDPTRRALQRTDVTPVTTSRLRLQILAVRPGSRNITAISEIGIGVG